MYWYLRPVLLRTTEMGSLAGTDEDATTATAAAAPDPGAPDGHAPHTPERFWTGAKLEKGQQIARYLDGSSDGVKVTRGGKIA